MVQLKKIEAQTIEKLKSGPISNIDRISCAKGNMFKINSSLGLLMINNNIDSINAGNYGIIHKIICKGTIKSINLGENADIDYVYARTLNSCNCAKGSYIYYNCGNKDIIIKA